MSKRTWTLFCSALMVIGCARTSLVAATADAGQGLTVTFEPMGATEGRPAQPDVRMARLLALDVPAGAAPSPFTPAGRFRATFEGDINVRLRSYVTFAAQGRGSLALRIDGQPVLTTRGEDLSQTTSKEVRLNKGRNRIVAVYESPAGSDAQLRLFWSSRQWQAEPVPPMVFMRPQLTADAARSLQVRDGRFWLAQLRCARCHAEGGAGDGHEAMPELAMDAPDLSDAGARLNAAWIAAWVANPRALRADAHMPRLFGSSRPGADDHRARDIAAYLASLGRAAPRPASTSDATAGGRLFANLDCMACHVAPGDADDASRISLKLIKAKYRPAALIDYLRDPAAHYAWNPMPNFRLSPSEAGDLAAYLFSASGADMQPVGPGDAEAGHRLATTSGCLNCHRVGDQKSAASASALAAIKADSLDKGCLAADPSRRGGAPDFALGGEQRSALVAFLETDRSSLRRRSPPEFAERQIAALRCTACHARDGTESLLVQGLDAASQSLHQRFPNPPARADELFAADQRPPMLTWAGEKLRPGWMAGFIGGRIGYKPRYYLRARMPSFAVRADLLAAGLAEEHGCPPVLPPDPVPDPKLAEAGRNLCSRMANVGFSCVQCHAVGEQPPFSPFEAPSINLRYVSERLRHDYYQRWMHDPLRIDPNAKMPRFDDADGRTGLPAFDGNAARQFDAIWQYLLEGPKIQPPPG